MWEECTGQTLQERVMYMDGHYKWEECTWTDITSERNGHGRTLLVRGMYRGQTLQVRCDESKLKLTNTDNFQLWSMTPTHSDRQSDIVDYRAAYFAAKN